MSGSVNYTQLESIIAAKYMPTIADNVFLNYSPTLAWGYTHAKELEGRKLVTPLEYADGSNTQMYKAYGTIAVAPTNIYTAAEWEPKLADSSLVIDKKEEKQNKTSLALKDLIDGKIKNVEKGMAGSIARAMFRRPDASSGAMLDASYFNSLDFLINDVADTTVGGIVAGTAYAWWLSKVFTKDADFTDNLTIADMINSAKDTYYTKVFARMLAMAKFRNSSGDMLFVLPQEQWDGYEFVLDQKKGGSGLGEMQGVAGFDALKYRRADVVAEDAMVLEQASDVDGEFYCLNSENLFWAFTPGTKMDSDPFVPSQNSLTKVKNFFTMGDMVTNNRQACNRLEGVASTRTYVNAGSAKSIEAAD